MAKVLIIDDNYDMLSMLQMILERHGDHNVIACSNGQEGLEAALNELPELALVDVMMPGMSGYEVVTRLRADPRTENMGIIILTARGQAVDREAALAAGADDHISKPADVEELMEHINTLLNRSVMRSQLSNTLVFPVFGLKGGVGVTTIAVNLANILQQVAPTVLWDLSPTSGQCAFYLRLRPEQHWGHYLDDPNTAIGSLTLKHPSGVQILLAPPIPAQYRWLDESDAGTILKQLKGIGRFVVIDMPPLLDATVQAVLAQAHHIVLVTGDDPCAIQVTRATLQALQEWKNRLVIVRNSFSPSQHPPAEALQKALRAPLAVDIPYDPLQSTVLQKGLPLAAVQPKAPLIIGIKRIAQLLLAR
jgi:CheY-like chemotaxis protein